MSKKLIFPSRLKSDNGEASPQTLNFSWVNHSKYAGFSRYSPLLVFAGFMMVERFVFEVHELTGLYLINLVVNIFIAPVLGKVVAVYGERKALVFEYVGLVIVFLSYGGVYFFGWGILIAAMLYVMDHIFFGLALALKTYFQKIADPADIASSAGVSFTINHIAAVFIPVLFGFIWLHSPSLVFLVGAGIALASLLLALNMPSKPSAGNEVLLGRFS